MGSNNGVRMIRDSLEKIGLTEGEIQVYEALIDLGLSSTGIITKRANIASSKVYEVLQRLSNKGLVSFVVKNGVRYYDATPPERLLDFLEERKDGLSQAQETIRKILPALRDRRGHAPEINQTIVYTGSQGPKIVLNEILEAGKHGLENCGYGTSVDPYVTQMPRALHSFIEKAKRYKFRTRLIFGKGFRSPNTKAEVRYLAEEYLLPVRTMLYGNKVAIVDFTKPVTTIIIEKQEISKAYWRHFETLWKIAKKR